MSSELLTPAAEVVRRRRRVVEYPDEDGKPMAETDPHVLQIIYTLLVLRYWLRATEQVYVGANMFLYYEEGRPKRRVAPDVFVAWGVSKRPRRSYKLWEEKEAPQVIFEITSRKTQHTDFGTKRAIYAWLGVAEYYLFDPYGQYLNPPLRGYQLVGEEYMPRQVESLLPPTFDGKEFLSGWRLKSERLKLELWALPTGEADMPYILRFYDSAVGEWLSDPQQAMVDRERFRMQARKAEEKWREAEAQAHREAQARKAAEERAARLETELKKLRSKSSVNSSAHE